MHSDQMMKVFNMVSQFSSTNDKLNVLQDIPEAKIVYHYTYNPYKKYYIKHIPQQIKGEGLDYISQHHFNLLDALNHRTISGNAARKQLYQAIKRLRPLSGELMRRIVERDLKIGVGVTLINRMFPNTVPVFGIMSAYYDKYDPSCLTFPCYVSPKINGWRGYYRDGVFLSRRGKEITGLDHLVAAIRLTTIVTQIDGELIIPGKTFEEMAGDFGSNRKCPTARYCMFDLPGLDLPFNRRLQALEPIAKGHMFFRLVPHYEVKNPIQIEEYYQFCLSQGFEGLMIKDMNGVYEWKESKQWMKYKQEEDFDMEVVSLEVGKGKYSDSTGTLVCDYKGKEARCGEGMTDVQRDQWWRQPNLIVGKVITVTAQELTTKGVPKHPRLKMIREDK